VSRLVAIRNGRGQITGYIRLYWAPTIEKWVSIPERD
jgi:hypothetical protein